ncbi:3-hydroxyacyl-CoA dehydrogenase [Cupriavidus pinatubonensis]|uniref:L-carnitine dehydrogenase n=1 Tax=Cupriavidus pinatubonensis TaxID=248026 RepID=A0ABN7ZF81_9BURK|nr:3-hydroxyacyl-CoA dehydrogenase [Cupriavidus pinatubonensis]CAG9183351.1 L-carnitine dehydrogenase [Cupriavidus pinatubonensis]
MTGGNGDCQIGVVGAGMIGRAWAMVFAQAGFKVQLHNPRAAKLASALQEIEVLLGDLASNGLLRESPDAVLTRIHLAETLEEACVGSVLVQENIPETVEAKRAIYELMDAMAPADAVLASSTSWLPASQFTEGLRGRARCLVAHPANPPYLIPLVEVCPAPWTSSEAVQRALSLYKDAGQEPVLVRKEISGFLLNRVQGAVLNEMLNLYEHNYASTGDLDKVMKFGLGLRWSFMGPFETIDLNAPNGVLDYAERYGPSYATLAKSQEANAWNSEVVQSIDAERRQALEVSELPARGRWRDNRLMTLRRHQTEQPE